MFSATILNTFIPSPLRHTTGLKFCFLFFKLFLVVLGLHCCAWAFSDSSEQGLLSSCMCGPHIATASLVADMGVQASAVAIRVLGSCGTSAQVSHSMYDLPTPGIELMSPALAGRFLTTGPPGKSQDCISYAFTISKPIMTFFDQ